MTAVSSWPEALARLKAEVPDAITGESARPGVLAVLAVPAPSIRRLATWLRDEGTFSHCSLVLGIDWIDHMEVVYHLWSDALKGYLELSVTLPAEDPHVDSLGGVWGGAIWHERETWDLLGIRFDGHPDPRRLLMPEGYKFHPLRKSFELREPEELEVKSRHV